MLKVLNSYPISRKFNTFAAKSQPNRAFKVKKLIISNYINFLIIH